jgi:hypothetical protein
MSEKKTKLPYQPPQITKVVLRPDQAILSQCSTLATTMRDQGRPSAMTCARGGDNCRAWDSTGSNADFGARPS